MVEQNESSEEEEEQRVVEEQLPLERALAEYIIHLNTIRSDFYSKMKMGIQSPKMWRQFIVAFENFRGLAFMALNEDGEDGRLKNEIDNWFSSRPRDESRILDPKENKLPTAREYFMRGIELSKQLQENLARKGLLVMYRGKYEVPWRR